MTIEAGGPRYKVVSDEWTPAPVYVDPPAAPPGYVGEAKYDSYMGFMEEYRYRLSCPDTEAQEWIEGRL